MHFVESAPLANFRLGCAPRPGREAAAFVVVEKESGNPRHGRCVAFRGRYFVVARFAPRDDVEDAAGAGCVCVIRVTVTFQRGVRCVAGLVKRQSSRKVREKTGLSCQSTSRDTSPSNGNVLKITGECDVQFFAHPRQSPYPLGAMGIFNSS